MSAYRYWLKIDALQCLMVKLLLLNCKNILKTPKKCETYTHTHTHVHVSVVSVKVSEY